MKKVFVAAMVLGLVFSISNLAVAGAPKVDVCHVTGHGGLQMLSISTRALNAHIEHGDFLPGELSFEGVSYPGLYGSTVTPIQLVGDDCSRIDALKIEATMNFQQGQPVGGSAGWAGWSCLEIGYPKVVGGGVIPEDGTIIAQGMAKDGAASIDGYNYPVYPHYTYPAGEEGWVVEAAGATPPTSIYVLCGGSANSDIEEQQLIKRSNKKNQK